MNDSAIVKNMIKFIEKKEKDIQAEKMGNATKSKTKAVTEILKELEREIKNEDQNN